MSVRPCSLLQMVTQPLEKVLWFRCTGQIPSQPRASVAGQSD